MENANANIVSGPLLGHQVQSAAFVAGFMFGFLERSVVLVRRKPIYESQPFDLGMLDCIGGRIEPGDNTPAHAMAREFNRQALGWIGKGCGLQSKPEEWQYFCHADGGKTPSTDFFACKGNSRFLDFISETRGMAGEQILIFDLDSVHPNSVGMVKNLRWLIALALDFLNDGRPAFTTINYPG